MVAARVTFFRSDRAIIIGSLHVFTCKPEERLRLGQVCRELFTEPEPDSFCFGMLWTQPLDVVGYRADKEPYRIIKTLTIRKKKLTLERGKRKTMTFRGYVLTRGKLS